MKRIRIVKDWRKYLRSYSALSHLANILQALSVSGLSVLGVISVHMAFKVVLTFAVILGVIGFIGRFIKQESISGDDNDSKSAQ